MWASCTASKLEKTARIRALQLRGVSFVLCCLLFYLVLIFSCTSECLRIVSSKWKHASDWWHPHKISLGFRFDCLVSVPSAEQSFVHHYCSWLQHRAAWGCRAHCLCSRLSLPALKFTALLLLLTLQLWFCSVSLPADQVGLHHLLLCWSQGEQLRALALPVLALTSGVGKALGSEISGEKARSEKANRRSSRPVSGVEFEEVLLLLSDCFLCLIAITPMEELHLKANFVFYLRANGFLCASKICILME